MGRAVVKQLDGGTPDHVAWLVLAGKVTAAVAVMSLGGVYGASAYYFFQSVFKTDGVMLWSFLAGVPLVIGIIIEAAAQRRFGSGPAESAGLSLLAVFMFVFASGALFREGTICIVMALPLFLVFVLLGALVSWFIAKRSGPPGPKAMSLALIAPALAGSVEASVKTPDLMILTVREIFIAAPPSAVWHHINYPTAIQHHELASGIAYRIGVPYPIEARTLDERVGGKRELRWERGISFEEIITEWEPEKRIAWTYRFNPNSFPPGSLDDHIVIGGRYFDLVSTSYDLKPEADGTRLIINVATRVTTNFNWYAGNWARYLVDDTAEAILKFYKARSESPPLRDGSSGRARG